MKSDLLDRVIQKCRLALHEGRRAAAIKRRGEKRQEAAARVRIAEIEDRLAFNCPIRDRIAGEALKEYAAYTQGVKMHRQQLLLMAVRELGMDDDGPAPVNDIGERLDF